MYVGIPRLAVDSDEGIPVHGMLTIEYQLVFFAANGYSSSRQTQ